MTVNLVSIVADFTAQPLLVPLSHWLSRLEVPADLVVAPYGQVQQVIFAPDSILSQNRPGWNVLLLRPPAANRDQLKKWVAEYHTVIRSAARHARPLHVMLLSDARQVAREGVLMRLAEVAADLQAALTTDSNCRVWHEGQVRSVYPVASIYDPVALRTADIPYSPQQFTALATFLARQFHAASRPPFKVVVTDCDNTLWGGVVGEVGVDNIRIDAIHRRWQQRLVQCADQGMLVCLCSKNVPEDVWAVFDSRADMILRRDHIVASEISWEPKPAGLVQLAERLRLGLDSFVFVDDSPLEIAQVREQLPQVTSLLFPASTTTFPGQANDADHDAPANLAWFDHLWPLDRIQTTQADRQRVASYRSEAARLQSRHSAASLEHFWNSLQLELSIQPAEQHDLDRATQLVARTNQFNTTLRRHSQARLAEFMDSPEWEVLITAARDRFGDYGQIGLMVVQWREDTAVLDSFMLSCRALGRTVEFHMLQHVAREARRRGVGTVELPFTTGPRNTPAIEWLQFLADHPLGDSGTVRLPVDRLIDMDPVVAAGRMARQGVSVAGNGGDQPRVQQSADRTNSGTTPGKSSSQHEVKRLLERIPYELREIEQIESWIRSGAAPRPELPTEFVEPSSELESWLANTCAEILQLDRVGLLDPLSALGCSSLQIALLHSRLVAHTGVEVPITELFTAPNLQVIAETFARAAQRDATRTADDAAATDNHHATVVPQSAPGLSPELPERAAENGSGSPPSTASTRGPSARDASDRRAELRGKAEPIAIIGMAGRFPGAPDVDTLWKNLAAGVESIRDLSDEELNLPPDSPWRKSPDLVRRTAHVDGADLFDAAFFGIFPREAQLMDPQHRMLLECAWHALEDAGYRPDDVPGLVGVYAGCYMNTYALASLHERPELLRRLGDSFFGGELPAELGHDKDYLATRIAFMMNLRGPAVTVQTACSTSLVAVIQACQALQQGACDMALAGGVTIRFPQKRGYVYTEGSIVSPDGHCRAFDAAARGTVFGDGAAMLVLKRLDDALRDGDGVYAVLRGWGMNNDGHRKVSYPAPSPEGQSAAIRAALNSAGISADSIAYVEAHGTGTSLGDPIEVAALTEAFRHDTDRRQYCGIGSIKTNIGHLDVAAGVTSLIKVALALQHELIPPTLHFEKPNPNIDFEQSPFYVVARPQPWPRRSTPQEQQGGTPRRAGVSSYGVGGTNAHVIVEEAPVASRAEPTSGDTPPQLLVWSARSGAAADQLGNALAQRLEEFDRAPASTLADVAWTLQCGRKHFANRRAVVATSLDDAAERIRQRTTAGRKANQRGSVKPRKIAFLFPGQGAQHVGMARGLYGRCGAFSQAIDRCDQVLRRVADIRLIDALWSENPLPAEQLNQTSCAQPMIFSLSYALAEWWLAMGVQPSMLIGHSVGEFVAACLAGVFSLDEALEIVAHRGANMQQLPPGCMLAVRASEQDLRERLPTGVEIAAVNGPQLCVASGPAEQIEALQRELEQDEIVCRLLHTSHAFHSAMMEPAIEPLVEKLATISLRAPKLPIASTATGKLLQTEEATDPRYWARHLRETVRFTDALATAAAGGINTFLEVGPGQTTTTLARQHPETRGAVVLASLPHAKQTGGDAYAHLLSTLGMAWEAGVDVDWDQMDRQPGLQRAHLPGYPFERKRFWYDQLTFDAEPEPATADALRKEDGAIVSSGAANRTYAPTSESPTGELSRPEGSPPEHAGTVSGGQADQASTRLQAPESLTAESSVPAEQMPSITVTEGDDALVQRVVQQQLQTMRAQLEAWEQSE